MFSLYEAPTPDETDTLQPKLQQVSLLGRCYYPKFQIKKRTSRVSLAANINPRFRSA